MPSPPTDKLDFLDALWRDAGLDKGKPTLVHSRVSSLIRFAKRNGHAVSPEEIIGSLIEFLGDDGTALFPLFNFDFTSSAEFSLLHTPSQMGVLTEVARNWPNSARSGHPIYSFAAIGADADIIGKIDNISAYGPDSPFAYLHKNDGQIAVIGLPDQNSMTFYHYVEECAQVDYRFSKNFSGKYQDRSGNFENRTYSIFVRNLEKGVHTDVNRMGDLLWQEGLYRGFLHTEASCIRSVCAERLFNRVNEIISNGLAEDYLYTIKTPE